MIICIIEFGVKPGKEEANTALGNALLPNLENIDGFISKETFESRSNPGKLISLSYWRDQDSLDRWNADRDHMKSKILGIKEIFSYYKIVISQMIKERNWESSK